MKKKMAKQPELAAPPLLVDAMTAAANLAICERKLWGLKASHELPFVQIGRRVLFAVEDLKAFIDAHRCQSLAAV